jgi:localization factor PodJL
MFTLEVGVSVAPKHFCSEAIRMTAPAPWSVKGIDPRAREVAKELARREGLTLGEWLNRMIVEQDGSVTEALPEPGRYARAQPDDPIPLEPSVRGLLGRVERGEREQIAVAARFEGLAEELRNDQMRLAERLRRMEQSGEGYGSTEALRALEQTVGRLANHIYETETTSNDAIRDLGACFVKLDGRLRKVEGGAGGSLSAELDQVRAEIAAIAEAAERKVARADAVHAQALERLGAEVARISERLAERIANAERRASMGVDEVSEQVSRVAERIHQRQERAAEDVTDRIRQAEERMARLLEETRAQVEASFAAARGREPAASTVREFVPFSEEPNFADPEPLPDQMLSTREVIEGARANAMVDDAPKLVKRKEGFSLFGPRKKKGSSSTTLQTALFVTGTAAALGAGVASYMLGVAEPAPSTVSVDTQPPVAGEPRLAIALDPQPADTASAPAVKPHLQKAADLYAEAAKMLKAKNWEGVEKLRAAASMGYPPAQFHLARLYESGGPGVVKDEIEARRWTEQAARGGEAKAMHNLALYYYEGTGIGKDPAKAAEWFRRAADKGLTDSQFNLGRLYEDGVGVAKDPAQAYHWYTLAARNGDAEAKASAERMAQLLPATPETR